MWEITPVEVTLVYITSQHPVSGYPTEVALTENDAKSIGLLKAGRIDFGKRDDCLPCDIKKVYGSLAGLPRAKIKECRHAARAAHLLKG